MDPNKPVVIISGGSRGLGSALIKRCFARGYRVATFSRSRTPFIQEQLEHDPDHFLWEKVDVANPNELKNFVSLVSKRYKRVDALINNVGIGLEGILATMRSEDITKCLDLNLKSAIILTQLCCKPMLRQQSGCIVNISSVNGIRGHSGVAVYSATKAALDGLSRSLARELGPQNIRVNSVAPGFFESEMIQELSDEQKNRIKRRTPLGRLANVDDIVNGILFMISPESSFITGQTLVIDGGLTC